MRLLETEKRPIRINDSHNSKGNQLKWMCDGKWYKADFYGYEGLAEVVVSDFLKKSNLRPGEFTVYEPAQIIFYGKKYNGCVSNSFLNANDEIVTVEKLVQQNTSMRLAKQIAGIPETEEKIAHSVGLIEGLTGISDFGTYLTKMLEIDAFFLNEDRHTNNISLIYSLDRTASRPFFTSPFYDMGAALFSDTLSDYPLVSDDFTKIYELYRNKIEAKPFNRNFDQQLDAAQKLYGYHLKFDMKRSQVEKYYSDIINRYDLENIYDENILSRVGYILNMQARKYSYMFTD